MTAQVPPPQALWPNPVAVAVLASGGGSTLQALLDGESPEGGWRVEAVASDRPEAGALQRAAGAGRRARVIPVDGREPTRVADEMLEFFRETGVEVVAMAGYLRLLPPSVVGAFPGRVLNVHPSLLPAFGGQGMYGLRVHRAVLESGARVTGATVHVADEAYDRGTTLAQWPVPVLPGDSAESLAARVQEVERILYPLVLDRLARAVRHGRRLDPLSPAGSHFIPFPGGEVARRIREAYGEP